MPGMTDENKGDKMTQVSGSGQPAPLTGVDDGVHLQLGDVTSEQGDLLVELLVLLVLRLLHLHGQAWNKQRPE